MFTLNNNNIELRNIQEQVQKNKEDIAAHYEIDRALANFGIKIVGTVATPQELPDPLIYTGEYGDGYAVGEPGSYVYYIYTRPDPNAGRPDNHWLDVGSISVVGPRGPEGPVGPKGDQGVRGTRVWTGMVPPTSGIVDKDLFLPSRRSTQYNFGTLYTYNESAKLWTVYGTIQGPQGIQGIQGPQGETGPQGPQGQKGDRGDVGGLVNIVGILDNTSQLPTPESIDNPTVAYLVGVNKDLYIQIGETPATSVWQNMGQLNVATYVTSGGEYQNIWNADTKVSVDAPSAGASFANGIYGKTAEGEPKVYLVTGSPGLSAPPQKRIVQTNDYGCVACADPINPYHTVNKQYFEGALQIVNDNINYLQQQLNNIASYNFCTVQFFNYTEKITIQFAVTLPYTGGLPTDISAIIQSLVSAGQVQPVSLHFKNITPNYEEGYRNTFEGTSIINYNYQLQTGTATITYYDNYGDIQTIVINLNDVINWMSNWEILTSQITPIG